MEKVKKQEPESLFVGYNEALALKELGFDKPCFGYYDVDEGYSIGYTFCYSDRESQPEIGCSAPTFSQAFRWFREKHELYQAVYADKRADDLTLLYKVHVYKLDEELSEYAYRWFKTYEEAESACLDKLIEIVKNK
jgi:hypothetical protein